MSTEYTSAYNFKTPVAGFAGEQTTLQWAFEALSVPDSEIFYTGTDYASLYASVVKATPPYAASFSLSTNAVLFTPTRNSPGSRNNFTVLYNASWPTELVSVCSELLNNAVHNFTAGQLKFSEVNEYCL